MMININGSFGKLNNDLNNVAVYGYQDKVYLKSYKVSFVGEKVTRYS